MAKEEAEEVPKEKSSKEKEEKDEGQKNLHLFSVFNKIMLLLVNLSIFNENRYVVVGHTRSF